MTQVLPRYFRRYILALLLGWSLVCLGVYALIETNAHKNARNYALESARESLQKDLLYRLWNAGRGGVYVPVSKENPPNPDLSQVPNRDLVTVDGLRLTLINPAYMTRQVHELGQTVYGSRGHITSLKPLRAANGPDAWEAQALQRFAEGASEFDEVVEIEGVPYLRAMIPLATETSCLKCHAAQGYRAGDIRGGLSVAVPLKNYLARATAESRRHGLLLLVLWGSGVGIILFGGRQLTHRLVREEQIRTELTQSEQRYRQLFDNMSGAFALCEIVCNADCEPVDYRILSVNPAFEPLFKLQGVALFDRSGSEVLPPEEFGGLERLGAVALGGTHADFTHYSERLGRYLGIRLYSPGAGQFALLCGDIDERITAERKIKESQQRFQDLVNSADGIVWELDLSTFAFTFVGRRVEALFGYPREEWYRPNFWREHLHPEDRSWAPDYCVEQAQRQRRYEFEYRMLARDGRVVWVRDLVSVRDADGGPTMLSGVMIDVTEAKKAAQQLEEYRIAVEGSQDMIAVVDRDFRYVLANPAYLAGCGRAQNEVAGAPVREIWGDEVFAQIEPRLKDAFAGQAVTCGMERLCMEAGRRDVQVTYAPVHTQGKVERVVTVLRDVTTTREVERALVAASVAANAANRAKTEFLANMSHELRTPLNGMLGMLQLLALTDLAEEQREYVETSTRSGWGLLEILNDLLDLTRIEAGQMQIVTGSFSLEQTVKHVGDLFAVPIAEKHLVFTCRIDPHLPSRLLGDEARLRQILFNLLGNAIKFTPEGGRVELIVKGDGQPLFSGAVPVGFTIADSGIGIEAELLESIFDPFVQGEHVYRKHYQGAGLGLSIVKRLVEKMGGDIQVESCPGVGTTMFFNLPFQPVLVPEPLERREIPASRASRAPAHILLVEDNVINRFAIERLLSKSGGYRVTVADNGREALQRLAEDDFTLVLMDVQMPVMDGMEALAHIRAGAFGVRNPRIPVVALTAYAMASDRDKFLKAGMDAYLAKPVEWKVLEECLAQLLARF